MASPRLLSRRGLLAATLSTLECGRRKATGYPGYAFVANHDGHSVAAVDLSRFRMWRQIPLDEAPSAVIAHPAKPRVLALAPQAGAIYEIDATSLKVSRRARAGSEAAGMRLALEGNALWMLSRGPAELIELPLESLRPTRRIRLPFTPDDFDISHDGRAAIVFRANRRIAIASLAAGTVDRIILTQGEPSLVRFQSDGRQVLVGSYNDRSVTIFDVASGRVVVRLPLPIAPRNFCFNSNGGQLFVTGEGMDAVVIVYPYNTEIDQTILAGRAPDGMAVTDTYLLVANPDTNRVTVFDIETRKLAAVVNVGQEPRHILITPDEQYALVLNRRSGDMAVIRIASLGARRYKSAPLFTLIPVGEGPAGAAIIAIA